MKDRIKPEVRSRTTECGLMLQRESAQESRVQGPGFATGPRGPLFGLDSTVRSSLSLSVCLSVSCIRRSGRRLLRRLADWREVMHHGT